MTLAIVSTPSPTPYAYGDETLSLTLAVSGSLRPHWTSSDGGTFFTGERHVTPSIFTPNNETQTVVINGRRVIWLNDNVGTTGWATVGANLTALTGLGNLIKTSGSTWADTSKAYGTVFASGTGKEILYEFRTAEVNTEKAAGLTTNTTNSDPTDLTGTPLTFMWHLFNDGTARPTISGVGQGEPIEVTAEDTFKIHIDGVAVYFMCNNEVVATTTTALAINYYPIATIKTNAGTLHSNVYFTDTDGAKQGVLTFDIYGVFPVQPNYPYEINVDNKTLASYAEDGSAVFRVKGSQKKSLSLQFNQRPFTEYESIYEFWEWHQKNLTFVYRDVVFDLIYFVVNDSGIKIQASGMDNITMSLVLREV